MNGILLPKMCQGIASTFFRCTSLGIRHLSFIGMLTLSPRLVTVLHETRNDLGTDARVNEA